MSKKNVEWEWKKLGNVSNIYNGNSINEKIKKECYSNIDKGFPFIATKDVSFDCSVDYENGIRIPYSETHFKTAPKDTVLICAEGGSAGRKKCILNQTVCFGNKLFAIDSNKALLSGKFVFYYVHHDYFLIEFKKLMAGIIGGVSSAKFKEIPIPIPPLDEQERIVKVLDDAFEKIDAIKTTAETNLQNAKEVFNAALSHEFDKTKFRTEKLSVCTYIRPPKNETIKGLKQTSTVSFLPMEDLGIHTRSISAIKSKLLSEVEGSYTCFANNDVLLAKVTPCFENGKMGIAENLVNGVGFGSSEYIVFRPSQNVDNVYLFYFLMTKDFVNEGKKQMLGACGLKRLSKDYVANTQIPLPPLPIQKQIVAKLDSLSEKVKQLESNYKQVLADCDELKKAFLKQAFEGML